MHKGCFIEISEMDSETKPIESARNEVVMWK